MEKKNKINIWKVLTIILLILNLVLITNLTIKERKNREDYSYLGDIKISKENLDNIVNVINSEFNNKGYICDVEKNKCYSCDFEKNKCYRI